MKEQIKQLFSDMRLPSLGEIIIAGLVITIIVGLSLADSLWGIVIAGIIVFVFLIEWKNPTF